MMKKLFSYMLLFIAAFGFVACSSDDDDSPATPKDNAPKGVEAVDLGLSVKWANMNIGATTPEGYGDYFAWGETKPYYTAGHAQDQVCTSWNKDKEAGYDWPSYFDTKDGGNTFATYAVEKETKLKPERDAAQANWKGSWRMPTKAEQDELREKCTWTWTKVNGVAGYRVTGTDGKNSIFIPAAGCRKEGSLYYAVTNGYYWSSSLHTDFSYDAFSIIFGSDYVDWLAPIRIIGRSVRAVCP